MPRRTVPQLEDFVHELEEEIEVLDGRLDAIVWLAKREDREVENYDYFQAEITRLNTFIKENIPSESKRSEGAIDTAIRLLGGRKEGVDAKKNISATSG